MKHGFEQPTVQADPKRKDIVISTRIPKEHYDAIRARAQALGYASMNVYLRDTVYKEAGINGS
jgi:hypothetical protein